MPVALQIAGPTVVKIGSNILGYSDNDTLPSISISDHQREIKTVLSGDVPEEIVLQGTDARISVALVKWDTTVLSGLLATQRGTANVSPVGRRIVGDSAYFSLQILGASGASFTFAYASLMPDGVNDSQWGNRERVLTLSFRAIPNPTTGVLYT